MEEFLTSVSNGKIEFTFIHILVLNIITVTTILLTVIFNRKNPGKNTHIHIFSILQVIEFLSVNIWYQWSQYLAYPLPLFHCRLAKIILILFAVVPEKWRERFKALYLYALAMALFGGISSFAYPNPDPFLWPHITHIGYFFGHWVLIILSISHVMQMKKVLAWKDLLHAQILLLVSNIGILFVARKTGINYSYLLESPIAPKTFAQLDPNLFAVMMFVVYAILFTVSFALLRWIQLRWSRSINQMKNSK